MQPIIPALLVVAALVVSSFAPLAAFARSVHTDANSTETVTVQLDVTSPVGTAVAGTLVIIRTPGTGKADVQFRGTIDGQPADATALANEKWSDNSHGTVQITQITSWHASVPRPSIMSVNLSQAGPGLITINGIPLAASGPLAAPGTGDLAYVATNPGKGEGGISLLPRTGSGQPITDPLLVAAAMVTAGPLLIAGGMFVNRLARRGRRAPANAAP